MSKRRSQRKTNPRPEKARAEVPRLFLLDENVPSSIGRVLVERGHVVRWVQLEIAEGASDRQVADYADEIEATLITFNVKHFEPLIYRAPVNGRKQHPHYDPTKSRRFAGAIFMTCSHPQGTKRLPQLWEIIEHEFFHRGRRSDTRVILRIGLHEVCIEG